MARRAFVTGGSGFVGSRLLRLLLDRGWEVVALARNPSKLKDFSSQNLRVVRGDLLDPVSLVDAMRGCDAVFHLAAWYEIGVSDKERMEAVNGEGTRNVIAAAREAGVGRLVHCSTIGAHGATRGGVRDEDWYDKPSVDALHYTRSKRVAHEAVLASAAARDGLNAVLVSPGSIFGPGDHSIIATLLRYIVRGWLWVGFYRQTKMGFVDVDDVAEGLLAAYQHGARGRDYILVDRTLTMEEILSEAARLAGKRPPVAWLPNWAIRWSWPVSPLLAPLFGQGPWVLKEAIAMMDGVSLEYDGKRAREELGWKPQGFDEKMAATVRAFQARS